ncbi:serine/threonine-protein kinase DDB_G0283821-like [Saccostrea cucullata]|uniref:serine/threonine-protein kinase DDB_G0283821-like n=1 Tax=Saccostrea cuccullata TaxID=36930 RepID=UPI002ED6B73F
MTSQSSAGKVTTAGGSLGKVTTAGGSFGKVTTAGGSLGKVTSAGSSSGKVTTAGSSSGIGTPSVGHPADLCKTFSCGHGKCFQTSTTVFCVCSPGFTGKYCNKVMTNSGSRNTASAGNHVLTTNAHVVSKSNNGYLYKTTNNGLTGKMGGLTTTYYALNGRTQGFNGTGQHNVTNNNINSNQQTTRKTNGGQNTNKQYHLPQTTSHSFVGIIGSNNKITQNMFGTSKLTNIPGNPTLSQKTLTNLTNSNTHKFVPGSPINIQNQNHQSSTTRKYDEENRRKVDNISKIWPFGIIPTMVGVALALSVLATTAICCFFFWKRWSDEKKKRRKRFKRWDKKIRPLPPTKKPRPIHRY